MESDPQPNEEVTSANTQINTLTDTLENPTPLEPPTRDVQTFWSRLDTLVTHLEETNQNRTRDKLRSFTNQPERVCISSDNDINTSQTSDAIAEQSFDSFRVSIQRPFLDVKSIQLLRASIPNAVTNFPNTECTFWYYRLPTAIFAGTLSISISGVDAFTNATFTTASSGKITYPSTSYAILNVFPSSPNAGLVKYQTVSLTGLSVGSTVVISGITPAGYNGTFIVQGIQSVTSTFYVINPTTDSPILPAATWTQVVTDYIDWSSVPYSVRSSTGTTRGYFTYPPTQANQISIYASSALTGGTVGTISRSSDLYLPAPSSRFLHMVRLLPSNYKPELFDTDRGQNVSPPPASPYGWNRTFTDYPDLASELVKSCAADPGYDFNISQGGTSTLFIPNDISITLNSTLNKFILTGNNSYSGGIKYASYLSAGYEDSNLWTTPTGNITAAIASVSNNTITFTTTTSTSLLYAGMLIVISGFSDSDFGYNGTYTISSFTSTTFSVVDAFPPASPVSNTNYKQTSWRALPYGPTFLAAVTSGLFGLQNIDHTLVYGVNGQPFQINRTLNLRLGFTWNGLVSAILNVFPLNITTLTAQSTGTSVLASFFNRLRPVPLYYVFSALDSGLNASPYTSSIYTADSYADLVFTNTVSLYADFTGGSTYDSMANTQLLACVPMTASNLGVTFYNTTLYCPLTKISDQIYEIEIRMLTDTGAPYVIPNSAIVSLELALTY
jgi:hypothetical protein